MKIVVLELGFEDDDDAQNFANLVKAADLYSHVIDDHYQRVDGYDTIECRVENP